MIEISTTVIRQGCLIIVEGLNSSVTFYPNDKDKSFDALIGALRELGSDLAPDEIHNLDVQVTNIYKEYYEQRASKKTSDSEHLFLLASSEIKEQFTDQTGSFYAAIERDGHREILNMDYQNFDFSKRNKNRKYSMVLKIIKKCCRYRRLNVRSRE
jgi:hypothetical protein